MAAICQADVDKTVNIIFALKATVPPLLDALLFVLPPRVFHKWLNTATHTHTAGRAGRSILIRSLLGHQLPLIRSYIFMLTSQREGDGSGAGGGGGVRWWGKKKNP